jgi:hypothetical protein
LVFALGAGLWLLVVAVVIGVCRLIACSDPAHESAATLR